MPLMRIFQPACVHQLAMLARLHYSKSGVAADRDLDTYNVIQLKELVTKEGRAWAQARGKNKMDWSTKPNGISAADPWPCKRPSHMSRVGLHRMLQLMLCLIRNEWSMTALRLLAVVVYG